MTDRNTKIPGSQIKNLTITKADIGANGELSGKVLTVQNDGSVNWEFIQETQDYQKLEDNLMITAFRLAIVGSLTQFNMIDGIVDEYEDESGIDTVNSLNELYNSIDDYYGISGDTPPSSEYASDSYTKLLMHCNGTDGSTTFVDSGNTGHTLTTLDNAQLDTAKQKFGTASGLFDGTNDGVTAPDHADWDFGSGDFTIDCWLYLVSSSTHHILSQWQAQSTNKGWICYINPTSIAFHWTTDGATNQEYTVSNSIILNQWFHLAVTRSGTNLRIFVNGTQIGSTGTLSGTIYNCSEVLRIAKDVSIGQDLNGWMDEVRISKGIARWTSDFDTVDNLTLISDAFVAEAEPNSGRIVLLEEDVDVITLNTDFKVYASRDNGSSWVQGTLTEEGNFDASKRILVADFDFTQSGIGSGTNMKYKLITETNKNLKIHATSLNWD